MKRLFYISIFMILAVLSCTKEPGPLAPDAQQPQQTDQSVAGRIVVIQADGLGKAAAVQVGYQDTVGFFLGDIKASRDFYFIIRNVGKCKIRDLSITSGDSSFAVSPGHIDVLPPDSVAAVSTVLRITAVHGLALDGVGYTNPMDPDTNTAFVTIAGTTTTNAGADTLTKVTVKAAVRALLMDLVLLDGVSACDLLNPSGYGSCIYAGVGWAPKYTITATASVVNTGNVGFVVSDPAAPATPIDTLSPGDTAVVPNALYHTGTMFLKIDGNNTVADYSKFQIGNDGAVYFYLGH